MAQSTCVDTDDLSTDRIISEGGNLGLAASLRRGTSHVAMKIAEGCGRDENPEFVKCLQQAWAMAVEVEYQVLLGRDLQFIQVPDHDALQNQIIEVRRMLSGLMKTLQSVPV